MYYLQTRYYDPFIGRFISADTFTTTDADGILSCNMFAYCENNPVSRSDPSGEIWNIVAGAIIGAAINVSVSWSLNKIAGNSYTWKDALVDIGTGALSGGLAASGVGKVGQIVWNAAIGGSSSIAGQLVSNGKVNMLQVAEETILGGLLGRYSGEGLAASTNAAKQIKTIGTNLRKISFKSARGNIKVAFTKLGGGIKSTLVKYFKASVFANANAVSSRTNM